MTAQALQPLEWRPDGKSLSLPVTIKRLIYAYKTVMDMKTWNTSWSLDNSRLPVCGFVAPAVNALVQVTRERSITARKIHVSLEFISDNGG